VQVLLVQHDYFPAVLSLEIVTISSYSQIISTNTETIQNEKEEHEEKPKLSIGFENLERN